MDIGPLEAMCIGEQLGAGTAAYNEPCKEYTCPLSPPICGAFPFRAFRLVSISPTRRPWAAFKQPTLAYPLPNWLGLQLAGPPPHFARAPALRAQVARLQPQPALIRRTLRRICWGSAPVLCCWTPSCALDFLQIGFVFALAPKVSGVGWKVLSHVFGLCIFCIVDVPFSCLWPPCCVFDFPHIGFCFVLAPHGPAGFGGLLHVSQAGYSSMG